MELPSIPLSKRNWISSSRLLHCNADIRAVAGMKMGILILNFALHLLVVIVSYFLAKTSNLEGTSMNTC